MAQGSQFVERLKTRLSPILRRVDEVNPLNLAAFATAVGFVLVMLAMLAVVAFSNSRPNIDGDTSTLGSAEKTLGSAENRRSSTLVADTISEQPSESSNKTSRRFEQMGDDALLEMLKHENEQCDDYERRWNAGEHNAELLKEWEQIATNANERGSYLVRQRGKPIDDLRIDRAMSLYHIGMPRVKSSDMATFKSGLEYLKAALVLLHLGKSEVATKIRSTFRESLPPPKYVFPSRITSESKVLAVDELLRNVRRYGGLTANARYAYPTTPWVAGEYCFLWSASGWNSNWYNDYEELCETSAVTSRTQVIEYLRQAAKEGATTVLYNYNCRDKSASLEIGIDVLLLVLESDSVSPVLDY